MAIDSDTSRTSVVDAHQLTTNGTSEVEDKQLNGFKEFEKGTEKLTNGKIYPSTSISDEDNDPIVIVGMGMRLPGGVTDATSFWDLLVKKRDGRCKVPADRYNVDAFYSGSEQKRGLVPVQYANFLQDLNLKHLDTNVFRLTRPEAEFMDPQQRLLLEVTREALENAGETQWRGKNIGCWVGTLGDDFANLHGMEDQDLGSEAITIYADFLQANRISYEFDFQGPSMIIKTACSSSLIALDMACKSLKAGECSSAIVGGTSLLLSPTLTSALGDAGVLSPTGSCKSFDASADGYARGEAINAIYLKRLSDAVRDGNPIRAVIKGIASNSDGRTMGITLPGSKTQEALIRRTYDLAGLGDATGQTAFVECHGTGTPIGDPLEAKAVANVFGERGIYIGSIKPNLGHSEGASGLSSIIKSVLALEHRVIPPNIRFNTPNPNIPFESAKLVVPVEPVPWPSDRKERISVNSFGIGGANAHVILDSASSLSVNRISRNGGLVATPKLLLYSGAHPKSVERSITQLAEYISENKSCLEDLAYTLGVRREHMQFRSFSVMSEGCTTVDIIPPLKSPYEAPQLNFIFTGQGSQWPGMGRELIKDYPLFLADIRRMDETLASSQYPPSWTLEDELLGTYTPEAEQSSRMQRAELSQPLCTAVQIGILNILESWGIKPAAVLGHSSGEIAAAYAAKAITMDQAILTAYYRGHVTKSHRGEKPGGMVAVGLGREEVRPYLLEGTVIACENGPKSVTLSGDLDKLQSIMCTLHEPYPEALIRKLLVPIAYHSHHVRELGSRYEKLIQHQAGTLGESVAFYSSVSGKLMTPGSELSSRYWRNNLESPVLFYTAVKEMLVENTKDQCFLEIGPHSTLQGPLRQIFKESGRKNVSYYSTMSRNSNSSEDILSAVGRLYINAVPINFQAMYSGHVLSDLPTYPWHYETEYWDESRLSREWRFTKFPHHDLLGARVFQASDLEPMWRNLLRLDDVSWIRDHQIFQDVIFPGAGYLAMAGEAIRQITNFEDFSLRHVTFSAAMILNERPTEILTQLRHVRLTSNLDSSWFELAIFSHNGSSWVKHCTGEVRGGADNMLSQTSPRIPELPRQMSSSRCYDALAKLGLNYGPRFRGLSKIFASTNDYAAVASMKNSVGANESAYQLHPSTIDLCFQVTAVAITQGLPRKSNQLVVPSHIDAIYICAPEAGSEIQMYIKATKSSRGVITAQGFGVASNGAVVISFEGAKQSPLESQSSAEAEVDPHAAAQIHWLPDHNFVQVKDLMKVTKAADQDLFILIEKLTLLAILESELQLKEIVPMADHLISYCRWISEIADRARKGQHQTLKDAQALSLLPRSERLALIKELENVGRGTALNTLCDATAKILMNFREIIEGTKDALTVLLEDETLKNLYDYTDRWDLRPYFQSLSHLKPDLRILEIGAGTGGTTAVILDSLVSSYGERMFYQYTYTDISAGFFVKAKERFGESEHMKYGVLDISKDPIEQGYEESSYDLIIAANVLHATPSLGKTLSNVRKLLHPSGTLFLQELCCVSKGINYIMGPLPGWFIGVDDVRAEQPYVQPERWVSELAIAGFAENPVVVIDDEAPYQTAAHIVARLSPKMVDKERPKRISLLRDLDSPFLMTVRTTFESAGYKVDECVLQQSPPPDQDVISLLDIDGPFLNNISEARYYALLRFVQGLGSSSMLWVTKSSQINCKDPRYAQILGLARTLRSELAVEIGTLELEDFTSCGDILKTFQKFECRDRNGRFNPDYEYAVSGGIIHLPRFHWISINDELASNSSLDGPKRLGIGKLGFLNTLQWTDIPPHDIVGDGIEIEVRAVGLNFRDVFVGMGMIDSHENEEGGFGLECAGFIRRIGPDVQDFTVGDRVFSFCGSSFSTLAKSHAHFCAKIPDELSFEDAATMPCVYVTVIYSLLRLAQLEKDQTVLIQSATGGVGIAALNICKMVGATVFATVGNDEKVQYLIDTFGIPRNRIFNSRDSSFFSGIMRETNGRGVDVVLNSLSGELLHASWECVAPFGTMLEIGKRDFQGRAKLQMDLFEKNRSFHGIDFTHISDQKPQITARALRQSMDFFKEGQISPIRPVKVFQVTEIEESMRMMQKGTQLGKLVIQMPLDPADLPSAPHMKSMHLRPDVSYFLAGGLGGLGRSVATWLVEKGAKFLIFFSRSAGKSHQDVAFIKELRAQGCTAQVIAGDVCKMSDVESAITSAVRPVAGILHMTMVLKDGPVRQMPYEQWSSVVSPKVCGTWNLHQASLSLSLDFFVLFSSSSGITGQWGQANYASANTFLDAFMQYRQNQGLPASTLVLGAIDEVGYVSQNKSIQDQFRASAVYTLTELAFLDSLHLAILNSRNGASPIEGKMYTNTSAVCVGVRMTMPIFAPGNRNISRRDVRMSLFANLEGKRDASDGGSNSALKKFLSAAEINPESLRLPKSASFLGTEIGTTLFSYIMRPIDELDITLELVKIGIDSLVAIELRNWARHKLGINLTVLEILGATSLEALGAKVAKLLLVKYKPQTDLGKVEVNQSQQ